ncbi:hypothetical protein [Nostoc sp. MS1]|uniref:hypothetical protein n=1 Tax=Nostoc sp. MS1 TaxID=2764711 RepID=UPI001CC3D050|nr:hypothetical protein [Nostoc sp. MS1]
MSNFTFQKRPKNNINKQTPSENGIRAEQAQWINSDSAPGCDGASAHSVADRLCRSLADSSSRVEFGRAAANIETILLSSNKIYT